MRTNFRDLLVDQVCVVADGGMGTTLWSLGLDKKANTGGWNLMDRSAVRSIHRSYIAAGSQIILTNTFVSSRFQLSHHGLDDYLVPINITAAINACQEAERAARPVLVAGDIGPTGQAMAMATGSLEYDAVVSSFAEQALALVQGGVDILWIETMGVLDEVLAAVDACIAVAPDIPVACTMTFDGAPKNKHGKNIWGIAPQDALERLLEKGVVAVGANCGSESIDEVTFAIEKMREVDEDVPLIAKANAGTPEMVDGVERYPATPSQMGEWALRMVEMGVRIIGGCCGTGPAHISAISAALYK